MYICTIFAIIQETNLLQLDVWLDFQFCKQELLYSILRYCGETQNLFYVCVNSNLKKSWKIQKLYYGLAIMQCTWSNLGMKTILVDGSSRWPHLCILSKFPKCTSLAYCYIPRFVSSTFYIVQILVHSHFELVSSPIAIDATEPVSQSVSQMAIEMINIHLISFQQKR